MIDNFGQCGAIYRSGHIEPNEYQQLVDMKIGTVINLEEDDDRAKVPATIGYVYLPLQDKKTPPASFADKFLYIIHGGNNHEFKGPFWVHCKGGRHRTGIAIAIYRINDCGWTLDQAKKEMDKFGWYSWFGHGKLWDYVRNWYWRRTHVQGSHW